MSLMKARFERGSGCYKCRVCGKRTRETGEGESSIELCRRCYDEAGLENDHSDNGHFTLDEGCPTCRAEGPSPESRKTAQVAS